MNDRKWKIMVIQADKKVYFSGIGNLEDRPEKAQAYPRYDIAADVSKIIVENNLIGVIQVRIISDQFEEIGA